MQVLAQGQRLVRTGSRRAAYNAAHADEQLPALMDKTRIDKWLWAARFFKTRSLATEAVQRGQVRIDGVAIKPARDVRLGDILSIRIGNESRSVEVRAISAQRGSASVAQLLYQETVDSVQEREQASERRRLSPEPALAQPHGRPTKRDRRALQASWGTRWSASLDS